MPRRVEKCPCGHPVCKDWHVHPEAAVQSVKFTESQARQVGHLLDRMDAEAQRPRIDTTDLLDRIMQELKDSQARYEKGFVPPNYIVPVRSDLLGAVYVEIEKLRNGLKDVMARRRDPEART